MSKSSVCTRSGRVLTRPTLVISSPSSSVTVLNNKLVPAWFDMTQFPHRLTSPEDERGLYSSAQQINAIIRTERTRLIASFRARNTPLDVTVRPRSYSYRNDNALGLATDETDEERAWASRRIILAGFSQGSVMSLLTGLTAQDTLAGIAVISGWLPVHRKISAVCFSSPLVASISRTNTVDTYS